MTQATDSGSQPVMPVSINPDIKPVKRPAVQKFLPVQKITHGPKYHFFGYFDKYPWDASGRYLLCHETDFQHRQPTPDDRARLCVIDLHNDNKLEVVAETIAFCWQQGCMLQWTYAATGREIIYNDRDGDQFVSHTLNLDTGEARTICRPVYCLRPNGRHALSLNFSRLDKERPGYGYAGARDPFEDQSHPDDDGIYLVDLVANTSKLIISYDKIVRSFNRPHMDGLMNWFNHMLFNPAGTRFAFFHRWRQPGGWHLTHMFTADLDGNKIHPLNLDDMSSHYCWVDENRLINFSNRHASGWGYYLYTDQSAGEPQLIGKDWFNNDGHCSYSTDLHWMLTDTYPEEANGQRRFLILYDIKNDVRYDIGAFYAAPEVPSPCRCDLHPNWSRDCRTVCIDSIHEGDRQVYILDVSSFTKG